jgi:hypothetical protein
MKGRKEERKKGRRIKVRKEERKEDERKKGRKEGREEGRYGQILGGGVRLQKYLLNVSIYIQYCI